MPPPLPHIHALLLHVAYHRKYLASFGHIGFPRTAASLSRFSPSYCTRLTALCVRTVLVLYLLFAGAHAHHASTRTLPCWFVTHTLCTASAHAVTVWALCFCCLQLAHACVRTLYLQPKHRRLRVRRASHRAPQSRICSQSLCMPTLSS